MLLSDSEINVPSDNLARVWDLERTLRQQIRKSRAVCTALRLQMFEYFQVYFKKPFFYFTSQLKNFYI